ncbi:MAG TPA: hypothetical protein VH684_09810 [Xanthobacteraceae bacterium]|jgi:hypothetical protein
MTTPLYDGIIEARPHSFGWLRRSEFDEASSPPDQRQEYYEAWERPDGKIVKLPRAVLDEPLSLFLFVRRQREPAVMVCPQGARQI